MNQRLSAEPVPHATSLEFASVWIKQDYHGLTWRKDFFLKIFKLILAEIRLILSKIIKTSFYQSLKCFLCIIPDETLQYRAKFSKRVTTNTFKYAMFKYAMGRSQE